MAAEKLWGKTFLADLLTQLISGQKIVSYITKLGYNELVKVWEGNALLSG